MISNKDISSINEGEIACCSKHTDLPTYEEVVGYTPKVAIDNDKKSIKESTESNEDDTLDLELPVLPSDLEVEFSNTGVISQDERLNQDSLLLKNFIYTYNVRPELRIHIQGTHKETYYITETYYENKVQRERRIKQARNIIDFEKEFDLTSFISPKGKIHNPDKYVNLEQELEQEIENYISSEAKLKELKIVKEVNWDYDKLNQKIKKIIRMSGYPHTVTIEYILNRKQIRVRDNNLVNTCINNPFYMALNVVSCLFIVTWPLSMVYKKEYGNQLISTFDMDISVNTWLTENLENIKDIIYEV